MVEEEPDDALMCGDVCAVDIEAGNTFIFGGCLCLLYDSLADGKVAHFVCKGSALFVLEEVHPFSAVVFVWHGCGYGCVGEGKVPVPTTEILNGIGRVLSCVAFRTAEWSKHGASFFRFEL